MTHTTTATAFFFAALYLAGCSPERGGQGHEGHDHDHGHEGHDHARAGETPALPVETPSSAFEVPENSQKLLGLTFVTAERRSVTGAVRFPGRFELMPDARRVYVAAVPGAVELRVRPPQRVKAGDALFTLHSPEWLRLKAGAGEAEAALALVKAEADALRARLGRLREAGSRNAELEQQLAVKEAEAVRAERVRQHAGEALRAVLALCREEDGRLVFAAREAGVVERVPVETGAWAETGAEVVCVARADRLWFRADGASAELAKVRDGQRGFAEPPGARASRPQERAEGRVELGFAADAALRVQPVYLVADALPAWAAPGRAGVLNVVVEESASESVALPQACVVPDGLKSVVFVRDAKDGDRFVKTEVTLGAGDGEWVEVSGVEPGASVVRDGAYELKLAAPAEGGAKKKAAGHFHADGQFHEGTH